MSVLTLSQRESIERFIKRGEDTDGLHTIKAIRLALLMAGEHNGCLLKINTNGNKQLLESILEQTGLPYRYERTGPIHRFFIAESQEHLAKSTSTNDAERGYFFGYPEDAIEYFSSIDSVSEFKQELDASDELPNQEEFYEQTEFIRYIPAPTRESIECAIRREERYEEVLSDMEIDWEDFSEYEF